MSFDTVTSILLLHNKSRQKRDDEMVVSPAELLSIMPHFYPCSNLKG